MQWDAEQIAMNNYAIKTFFSVPMSGGRRVRYNPCHFEGRKGVRIIFRKLATGENEHWLNEFACWVTSPIMPPFNKPPYNNNCHSEIVMDIAEGCTVRIGTMYKQGEETVDAEGNTVRDDKGKPVISWKPGKLFIHEVTKEENVKYQQFKHYAPPFILPTSREAETRMLCFALRNLGAPFDVMAYKMRAVLPITPGVHFYDPVENHVNAEKPPNREYFCAQLTHLCGQAAAFETNRVRNAPTYVGQGSKITRKTWADAMFDYSATTATPNGFFITLSTMPDVKSDSSRPDQHFSKIGRM